MIFVLYLKENFTEFAIQELIYALLWGCKFDFAASAIISFLVTCFDFNKKIYRFISASVLTVAFLLQIGDILYFSESSRHISYEISDMFVDAISLMMTALTQHTVITILSILGAFLLFTIFFFLFKNPNISKLNRYCILTKVAIIIVSIFFIRGMFQGIPLHPWQSYEIGNNKLAVISQNAVYNVIYALINQKKRVSKVDIKGVDNTNLQKSLNSLYQDETFKSDLPLIKSKPNIVFLFLESWSARFIKSYGYEKVTTPVYEELLKKSIRPKAMMANGHRTTEGIFATLTSFQNPLGKSIAKTQLQNFEYDSIIDVLNKKEYTSAFFQGTSKDTSGTGSLASHLGFIQSYGKKDIKERLYEPNNWGVQDKDLYNFVIKKLNNEIKEPFVLGINGATTHDRIIPKGIKEQSFSKEKNINEILNALNYSDKVLGEFINEIEKKYPNTVFVIFADHCGGYLNNSFDNYLIPFAIYSKKLIKPKYYDTILSQRDIAPTVYDLAIGDYRKDFNNATGKSLVTNTNFFADYFHNGILGWIENNNLLEINIFTKDKKCFVLKDLVKKTIKCSKKHKELEQKALAFTETSQKLLFDGETKKFNIYRVRNDK